MGTQAVPSNRSNDRLVVGATVGGLGLFISAALGAAVAFAPHSEDASSQAEAPAPVHRPAPLTAWAFAHRHGQPIVLLRRRTRLFAAPGRDPITRIDTTTEFGSPRVLTATAERHGWLKVIAPELPNGKRAWIRERNVVVSWSTYTVRVDTSAREITIRRDGRVVRRFPIAVGAPGMDTPTGRFAVTDKLRLPSSSAYGCCAIALSGHQTVPEPGWTGGDRLGIHTEPGYVPVGQAVSHGCMRAREEDARWMVRHLTPGTLVTIRN